MVYKWLLLDRENKKVISAWPEQAETMIAAGTHYRVSVTEGVIEPHSPVEVVDTIVIDDPTEPPKRRRGRPKGSKNKKTLEREALREDHEYEVRMMKAAT